LSECELRLERAAREALPSNELTRVGHPLVDQDDRRRKVFKQFMQRLPRRRRSLIGLADQLVPIGAAELPGELSPYRIDVDIAAVLARRGEVVTHDRHSLYACGDVSVLVSVEEVLYALGEIGDPPGGNARETAAP
jgi:hypothetical protein